MAVKSVIDIDINDESFKRFADKFGEYQELLGKQPDLWKKANKESGKTGETFAAIAASILAINSLSKEGTQQFDKSNKELEHHASLWTKVHRSTTGVLQNVGDIAKWLARMGVDLGLGAVGAGIAGLLDSWLLGIAYRINGLARWNLAFPLAIRQPLSRTRVRFSRTLIKYCRVLYLAKSIGEPQSGVAKSLGINTAGNAYQVADRILTAVQALAKSTPDALLPAIFKGRHLEALGLDVQGFELLRNISGTELQRRIHTGTSIGRAAGLTDAQGKAWMDFVQSINNTFSKVWKTIERSLAKSKLLTAVDHFVASLGKDAGLLIGSGAAAKGLNALADGIATLSKYVGSTKFQADIKSFVSSTGQLVTTAQHFGQHFGYATEAVGDVFTSPIQSTSNALDYWNNASGGWLKYLPPFALDTAMRHIVSGSSSPSTSPTVNVKTSHQITIKNATGGNVITQVNQLHGSTQ